MLWGMVLCAMLGGCRSKNALPKLDSPAYAKFVSLFYQGLAGLQVGDDVRAEDSLAAASLLAPGEPAVWVDWGVLALRQRNYDAAAQRLERARALTPQDDQVEYLLGLLESERGNSAAAIAHLQNAVQLNSHNLRAAYALATEVERDGDASSDQRFEILMQQVLAADPGNLAALLELCRVAAKRGDAATLHMALTQVTDHAKAWPVEASQQLAQLQAAAAGPDPRAAATRSIFLRNVLMRVPQFRNDLADLKPQPGEGAQPMPAVSSAGECVVAACGCGPRDQLSVRSTGCDGEGRLELGGSASAERRRCAYAGNCQRFAAALEEWCNAAIPGWQGSNTTWTGRHSGG